MASISDMMVQSELEATDPRKFNDLSQSFMNGAALAQRAQELQQRQGALAQQKDDHEVMKLEKVGSWFETASKMPDGAAKSAFIKDFVPNGIRALGIGDKIDPTVLKMGQGDPRLFSFIGQKIREGVVDVGILSNAESVAKVAASPEFAQFGGVEAINATMNAYRPQLEKLQDERTQQEATKENARIGAAAQMGRQVQEQNASPKVAASKKILLDYQHYVNEGGSAKVDTGIAKLEEIRDALIKGTIKTGGISKSIPGLSSDAVQSQLDPGTQAAAEQVRSAVNLKSVLDSSFSDAAAKQAYAQAFSPPLPNAENIKKLTFTINEMKAKKTSQLRNFNQAGLTVEGSGVPRFTEAQKKAFSALTPEQKQDFFNKAQQKFNGATLPDIMKAIGAK